MSTTGNPTPSLLHESKDSSVAESATANRAGQHSTRKPTGPRTLQGPVQIDKLTQTSTQMIAPRSKAGRHRSSHNALKHGIFSECALLPGESRNKYESLLKGFSKALQPMGRLEELLVEKLAVLAWRHRRLLLAEGAEIRRSTEFWEWDQRIQQAKQAEEEVLEFALNAGADSSDPDFIQKIQQPDLLERRLELLRELRQAIKSSGFEKERDSSLLDKFYGSDESLREDLRESYDLWVAPAETPEEERQREGYATPEECKNNVLSEVEAEIGRLQKYQRERTAVESERTNLETLSRKVPASEELDRLLRYEASLERSFDRTLNQLERMQRLRRGQPVAPRLDVNVAT